MRTIGLCFTALFFVACGDNNNNNPDMQANLCAGKNPVGCAKTGCPSGQKCDTNVGCAPSACGCDPMTGLWICTADCGGGTCVSETVDAGQTDGAGTCKTPNPQGCRSTGCPTGLVCDTTVGCVPSACGCDPMTGTWICTADCGGGTCAMPRDGGVGSCPAPSPQGCKLTGCPMGQTCNTNIGCKPSECTCDPQTGAWGCTKDCGGGTCV